MHIEKLRNKAIDIAMCFLGDPYEWGGDGVGGVGGDHYDCSGFIQDILVELGIYPPNLDQTAQNLFRTYRDYTIETPQRATVGFYGESETQITHCVLIINSRGCIGANGGNIGKISVERLDYYKKPMVVIIDPFKGIEDVL